jgi:predicted dehydrogenase
MAGQGVLTVAAFVERNGTTFVVFPAMGRRTQFRSLDRLIRQGALGRNLLFQARKQ